MFNNIHRFSSILILIFSILFFFESNDYSFSTDFKIKELVYYVGESNVLIILLLIFSITNFFSIGGFNILKNNKFKTKAIKKEVNSEFTNSTKNYNCNIRNFQGIRKIQVNLPFDSSWIFFTGDNGYGKTNILQALARGLSDYTDNQIYNGIKPINENCEILINIYNHTRSVNSNRNKNKSNYRIMGYGAGRLDMGSDRSTKKYAPASSLFESQVLLRNIEKEGLSRWFFKEKDKDKFDYCVNIFKKILPNLDNIIVEENNEILYIEKDKESNSLPPVQFKDLATGYQNIISMVGDIILNLTEPINHDLINVKDDIYTIVLIDEIELYLHPNLQKKLPSLLSELFPNILFIASTHSPIPLLGAPKNSAIYTVNRSADEGITIARLDEKIYIDELLPNTILTSPLFNMEDILSSNFSGEKQPNTETTYSDLLLNNEINKKVNNYLTEKKEKELIERFKKRNK